jgi:predicted amidohydrolase
MRVAVAQFSPVFKAYEENIKIMAFLVSQATKGGAQLVVLPELCTTGYSFMSKEEAEPFAENLEDGRSMQTMRYISHSLNVAIVWGLVRRDIGTGELFNSQTFVMPDGSWTNYDKINPWGNDFLWATEGRASPPIIDYLGKNVGLLICRDVRDKAPAWKNFYEPGDADVVCFSSNFGDGGFPAVNWVEFAKDNGVWFAVSNRYGREANNNFGEGGICVIEPSGKVHCDGLLWNQSCIVYADIP